MKWYAIFENLPNTVKVDFITEAKVGSKGIEQSAAEWYFMHNINRKDFCTKW